METPKVEYVRRKVLVLYLAQRCGDLASVSKLNKLLYFIDFGHFSIHGKQVTDFEYMKLDFGPVPYGFTDWLNHFEAEKVINKRPVYGMNYQWDVYDPLEEVPELSEYFSAEEIETITKTASALSFRSAKEDSEETHLHPGWVVTDKYSMIDIETSKVVAFPWLGYYGEERTEEDFAETEESRKVVERNPNAMDKIRSLPGL